MPSGMSRPPENLPACPNMPRSSSWSVCTSAVTTSLSRSTGRSESTPSGTDDLGITTSAAIFWARIRAPLVPAGMRVFATRTWIGSCPSATVDLTRWTYPNTSRVPTMASTNARKTPMIRRVMGYGFRSLRRWRWARISPPSCRWRRRAGCPTGYWAAYRR